MRMGKTCLILAACFFCTVLGPAVPSKADPIELECVLTAEDVGNGYEYTIPGIGTFTVNGRDGETLSAAVFSLEDGCEAELFRDGYEADFNDGVILENGSYELRIYKAGAEQGGYGVFHFTVENSYGDMASYDRENVVQVSNPEMELSYSAESGQFTYTLPDGEYFRSTVPFGGWAGIRAQVETSGNMNVYRVLKDGEPQDFSEGLVFTQPGSYRITMWDNELGLNGDTSYRIDYCFVLYSSRPQNVSHINAPMGFEVESVSWNGVSQGTADPSFAHLELDGTYEITFLAPEAGARWSMRLTRDTTAPALWFSEDISGGRAEDYLDFIPSDPDCQIDILWNGQQAEAYGSRLAMDGRYVITVTDQAGNSREYDFTLRKGFSIWSGYMIIIPVLLAAAAGGTILYWRRHMRVL